MNPSKKRRKRTGRRPLPKGQAKYTPVMFRVTLAFKKALAQAAKRHNQNVPTFIRACLIAALARER